MTGKQVIDFHSLIIVIECYCAPFVTCWQVVWLLLNLVDCLDLNWLIKLMVVVSLKVLRHWLRRPEVMFHEERDNFAKLLEIPVIIGRFSFLFKFGKELENVVTACLWVLVLEVAIEETLLKHVHVNVMNTLSNIGSKGSFVTNHVSG